VAGAQEILSTLRTVNEALPGQEEIYVSMGIGYGDVLMIGTGDLFGDEMNLACKLGEDLADRDQILLTSGARRALEGTPLRFEELETSISGIPVRTYRLVTEND
jgi:adenylate cyclase